MTKLYPPYLEGTIPAFYGDSITVPFAMNRAVGKNEIQNFSLIIKTIQTGQQIEKIENAKSYDLDDNIVIFNITKSKYDIGQSYKVQLSYIDSQGNEGYYSTVAVAKYTEKPNILIQGLNKNNNKHKYNYIGEYSTKDITEKMYSCQFKVYDGNNVIIADSGEIIHNSLDDEAPEKDDQNKFIYKATQQYNLNQELEAGKNYYIQFLVKTIGLMELDSGKYQIIQSEPIPLSNTILVTPYLDYNNGFISVNVKTSKNSTLTGKYALSRSSSKNNFQTWDEIMRFTLNAENQKEIWKDFTIEQGVQYKYSIFMVDASNQYSTKSVSEIIMADFEDMFLFDGNKQLKIRFNPKVNNFKSTILETKSDTIGGRFPYIFRNGYVNYKELSISGLLTHLMDDEGYFQTACAQKKYNDNNLGNGNKLYSTNLNSENVAMEREFKIEVMEWLNNGQPKLFRSPTEGNHIVRLMNTSLSPTDSLGRMLHTFSSNAYEIAEYTHQNLIDLKIIQDNLLIGINKIVQIISNGTIPLQNLTLTSNYLDTIGAISVMGISFNITNTNSDIWVEINGSDVNLKLSKDFQNIEITTLKRSSKQISNYDSGDTFALYYSQEVIPEINRNISSIDTIEIPVIQFNGINDIYDSSGFKKNLLTQFLCDNKEYLSQMFLIQCVRRPVQQVKTSNESSWSQLRDYIDNTVIQENNTTLYEVYNNSGKLLGYKDQGRQLDFANWSSLSNLSDRDKYNLTLVYEHNNSVIEYVNTADEGLILDSSDVDFNSLKSVYGSLFFSTLFCCRIGSKNMNNSDYNTYEQWIREFQETGYQDADTLNSLLNKIKSFWIGGI